MCVTCVLVGVTQIVKHEEYCPYLESIDPTVRCVHESKILPGVSYHSLKAASPNLIGFQGQLFDRVRWYFQQYLKLGVALHLEGLSERYLVWDSDSIPIKPFPLLADDGRVQLCATPSSKKAHDFGTYDGRSDSEHTCHDREPHTPLESWLPSTCLQLPHCLCCSRAELSRFTRSVVHLLLP